MAWILSWSLHQCKNRATWQFWTISNAFWKAYPKDCPPEQERKCVGQGYGRRGNDQNWPQPSKNSRTRGFHPVFWHPDSECATSEYNPLKYIEFTSRAHLRNLFFNLIIFLNFVTNSVLQHRVATISVKQYPKVEKLLQNSVYAYYKSSRMFPTFYETAQSL